MASTVPTHQITRTTNGLAAFRGIVFASLAGAGTWVLVWRLVDWVAR